MDEQVIDDLYNRAVSKGYKKSRQEFIGLLHSDTDVMNDMYSYVQSSGYKKGIDDFKSLIGATAPTSPELKKNEKPTELPSEVGSLASSESADPEALRFAELVSKQGQVVGKRKDEEGYIDPRKKLGMYPTQEEVNRAMSQSFADTMASKGMAAEVEEKDFFEGGVRESLRFVDQYVPVFNVFGIGEFIDDSARVLASGYSQGQLASAANDIMFTGTIPKDEEIKKLLEYNKMVKDIGPSDAFINYQKKSEELGGGWFGFLRGVMDNPAVLPELMVNSLASMATNKEAVLAGGSAILTNALAAAAAAGAPTAGVGAAPGFVAGATAAIPVAMGLASGILTTGATFAELLQQELGTDENGNPVEPTTENIKAVLENPEKFNRIRNKSIAKGATVGAIDFVTGKTASIVGAKILSKSAAKSATGEATRAAFTKSVGAGSAIESGGGMLGEFAGTAAAEEKQNLENILFEGITEMPMGALSTVQARMAPSVYKVNNKKVTGEQLDEIIDTMEPADLAKANIKIENDYEGRNKKMQDKIVTGAIANEVRAAQPDLNETTVNAIVDLQKQLNTLEGNKTQVAKDKAAQIRGEIKNLQENPLPEAAAVEPKEAVVESGLTPEERIQQIENLELELKADDNVSKQGGNALSYLERVTLEEELQTLKQEQDAFQKQAAGEVPVQSGATVSEEVAQGEPQAEPQVTAEAGVQEEVRPTVAEPTQEKTFEQLMETARIEGETIEAETKDFNLKNKREFSGRKDKNVIQDDIINAEDDVFSAQQNIGSADDVEAAINEYNKAKEKVSQLKEEINQVDNFNQVTALISDEIENSKKPDYEYKELFKKDPRLAAIEDYNSLIDFLKTEKGKDDSISRYEGYIKLLNEDIKKYPIVAEVSSAVSPAVAPTTLTQQEQLAQMEQMFAEQDVPTTPIIGQGISVTNKSAVDDIKTKTTDKGRLQVIEAAERTIKTLKSVLPNFDIVLHNDEGSFNAAMGSIGATQGTRGNFAIYKDGSGRIDINLSRANNRTVAHEVAHAIMARAFNGTPELYKGFRDRISKVLNESANKKLMDFANNYDENASYEEYLAELTAVLSQEETNLSVNTLQKIAAIINDLVSKITNGKFKPFEDIKDTKQVVDFFNTISDAIRKGEDIELNGGGEVGTFNFGTKSSLDVKDAPSAVDDSRTFIRDLVQDIDIKDFNGRKFVTNMYDYTTAGETDLGNGFTIKMLGGKNYVPYLMALKGKKLGEISNLAAFNSKAQAESFARNAIQGKASLFAPHSGTLSQSWQFQQHTFSELVNLIIDKNIMSGAELIDVFNKTIASNSENQDAFNAFKTKYGKDISNFDSFKDDPKKIVELLDIKNNYSPDLRKALNNAISADKTFQKAIGIKNKEEFFKRIMDPLNDGVSGGEIINVVDFDPNTFEIVQTKADAIDYHPSFGWSILAKINGIYQPTKFYKSSNITDSYVKYNTTGEQVSRKAEETRFEQKNVASSAGSIPKVAEFNVLSETEMPISKAQLIGEDANLSARVKFLLELAKDMESMKKSPKIIFATTGWAKGREGKWRYEIPDGKLKNFDIDDLQLGVDSKNNRVRNAKLGDIFSAPDLFQAYPEARNIKVHFKKLPPKEYGSYKNLSKTITINQDLYEKDKAKAELTLLHEIQHYIQYVELFETGSSPESAKTLMVTILDELKNKITELKENTSFKKAFPETYNKNLKSLTSAYKNMFTLSRETPNKFEKEQQERILEKINEEEGLSFTVDELFPRGNSLASAYNLYYRVAGEVEARNVEARNKLTPSQRKKVPFSFTEDVDRADQILFDNAVLMLEEEFPVSKAQLDTDAKAKKVVQQARAQGFSEDAIQLFLEGKGLSIEAIGKAMAKETPAAGRIKLSEETIKGYDSLMKRIDTLIESGTPSKEVISKLKNSKTYINSTDVQKETLVRETRKKLGLRQKSAPTVKRLFGQLKDITKITMTETELLKKRIREIGEGAKLAKKSIAEANKFLADEIKEMANVGKITDKQAAAIVVKVLKMNPLSEASISRFVDYLAKVFSNAEYVAKMTTALGQIKQAKKNIRTKIGVSEDLFEPLNQLLSINPTLIPLNQLEKYLGILEDFGARKTVLSVDDRVKVLKQVNEILDEINNELSLVDVLADRFNNYEGKVFSEDGLNYAETIKDMIDKGAITVDESELMKKYKSEILPQVEPTKLTDEEIKELKKEEIDILKKLKISDEDFPLPSRDEKEDAINLAKLIKELSVDDLLNLSLSDLKNMIKVIDNINNGYLPHYAKVSIEKLDAIKQGKVLSGAIERAKPLAFSKLYSRLKDKFTKKGEVDELIRANPLYYIDNVFGDFKTRDIFNSLLEKSSQALATFNSELKKVDQKIEAAQNKVLASFKQNSEEYLMSKFRMTAYMLQREYESNIGKKGVKPVAEYLKETIKHIRLGRSIYKKADAEKLEKILKEVEDYTVDGKVDLDKFYNTFNSAEKNAIEEMTEINKSLGEKAAYTAAVVRGDKVELMDNYVHHNVLHEQNPMDATAAPEFSDKYKNSMKPSTKAKSLIERTDTITPLNFDLFTATHKGAKFVLLDYNLTSPIRTARRTLIQAEKNLESKGLMNNERVQIFNAINNAYEEALQNILTNNITQDAFANEVVDFIQKQGYRAALAGTTRFQAELASNIANALLINPAAFTEGAKNMKLIASANGYEFMKNAKSKQTSRLYASDALSGKMVDPQILKQTSGIKGSVSRGALTNRTLQVYNLTLKKYVQNPVEYIADTLLSTPDKIVSMPLWFGSFMNEFKRITGEDVNQDMMINNDLDYMQKYSDAIQQATRKADQESVYSGASNNEFMGILKGKLKPNQGLTAKIWNNFNTYMTNFMNFDYAAARSAVYNLFNEGYMTKRKAAAVLAGITTRSVIYQVMVANMGAGIVGAALGLAFDWEDEEEVNEKSYLQMLGRGLANVLVGYTVGRNFGNAVRGMLNFGVEQINEEYLDFLRNGEYDFYKDNIAYTYLNVGDRGDVDIAKMAVNMAGPYTPALNTAVLIGKNFGSISNRVMGKGPTKKEPEAIRREQMTVDYRIPLELAGNAGLIPLYKDVKKAVNDEIYKDLRKAANTPESSLPSTEDYEELKDLRELKRRTSNEDEIKEINKKIIKIVGSEESKESIEKAEDIRSEKKKRLLYDSSKGKRYDNESDMKRLNPALWRRRFGPNSDWAKSNKAKNAVENKLEKVANKREDKEFNKR